MIPEFAESGELPRGRFCTDPDEVEQVLVKADQFTGSGTRSQVWSDFLDVVALVKRKRVRVPAAFISGSFVSTKLDPSDVDTSIIVDVSRVTNPATYQAVLQIARQTKHNQLRVDAFLIPWSPDGSQAGAHPDYPAHRGIWDGFWQRSVPKSDRSPMMRSHAMPKRGYLEVLLDGYS